MSEDTKSILGADRDTAAPVSAEAKSALKAWVTPKVMVSSLPDDTAASAAAGSDGTHVC
jgi:hypothetical protein